MIFLMVNPYETPFSWWLHTLLRPGLHTLGSCCDPNDQDLLSEEAPAATFGACSGSPEIWSGYSHGSKYQL